MLDKIKILDAINGLLVQMFPNHTVYIDICPVDFERPSFLLEFVKQSREDLTCKTMQETDYYTITCIDETDDYANSSTVRLMEVQEKVIDLFQSGFVRVEDRAVKVQASSGGRDFDAAFVDVQFTWREDRCQKSTEEKIENVHFNYKEE